AVLAAHEEMMAMCRDAGEPKDPTPVLPPRHAIRLRGVRVVYPAGETGQAGLDGIDADIPVGRITAVIGLSGAGKSPLADLVSGLTAPDA
ncbi:ATP-binding cassette domain-containing protein, partial [Acinetobacter baumannii]